MRVTTKMINNTMMANIASNKGNLDKLNNQYTTGNKIQKPSEDPIIAVRTLKLRKTMSEISQYTEKNIPDAMSWMDVTTSSLDSMDSILTTIYGYLNQGATDILSASERKTIATNLVELKNEIYSEGNANYAGRYVFTGYKTDTPLTFQEANDDYRYTITESFELPDIDEVSKLKGAYNIDDYVANNYKEDGDYVDEFDKTPVETIVHKIQLGYTNLCSDIIDEETGKPMDGQTINSCAKNFVATSTKPGEEGKVKTFEEFGITVIQRSAYDKNAYDIEIPLTDVHGNVIDKNGYRLDENGKLIDKDGIRVTDDNNFLIDKDDNHILDEDGNFQHYVFQKVENYAVYIPETGELILTDNAHHTLRNETSGITVTYDKEKFDGNDVRPEHYYSCVSVEKGITDREEATTVYTHTKQDIQYEINFGQMMKVNTQMHEALGNNFARDIDNLASIVNEVNDLEAQIADVDSFLANQNILPEQTKALTALKTQLNTQLIIKNKMMTQAFEDTIKKVQGYQVQINTANANLGSRYARLEMVEDRLTAQYTEYEELLSENIDADLVETYINLTSADNVYTASLQTAAKIAQNSLLDFIN